MTESHNNILFSKVNGTYSKKYFFQPTKIGGDSQFGCMIFRVPYPKVEPWHHGTLSLSLWQALSNESHEPKMVEIFNFHRVFFYCYNINKKCETTNNKIK